MQTNALQMKGERLRVFYKNFKKFYPNWQIISKLAGQPCRDLAALYILYKILHRIPLAATETFFVFESSILSR
jgi:hypothetical protein